MHRRPDAGPASIGTLHSRLKALRLVPAAVAQSRRNVGEDRGLVLGRQRPSTANGVTFVTLEDETGQINVVVWRDLAEKQRQQMLGARLLVVYGTVERQGDVMHLIAGHLKDLSHLLGNLVTHSRDFH